jgi:hypothetical protein
MYLAFFVSLGLVKPLDRQLTDYLELAFQCFTEIRDFLAFVGKEQIEDDLSCEAS